MTRKRVLVVDDNKDITEMVQDMLESSSYSCTTANSGEECLNLVQKEKFDLILLDVAMPEMSGLEVLRKLQENNMVSQSKVVLITASPMYSALDIKKIRAEYGPIESVKKPFSDTDLLSIITKYID